MKTNTIRKTPPSSPRAWIAALLAVAMISGACGNTDTQASAESASSNQTSSVDLAFWSPFAIAGDEVEGFSSLEQMSDSADLVVTAQVSDVSVSRTIQYDAVEDVVSYAAVTLDVQDSVKGSTPQTLEVEFLLGAITEADALESVSALSEGLPAERGVYFLRAKQGDGEEGLFRLVNRSGLLIEAVDGSLIAPLEEILHGETQVIDLEHSHDGDSGAHDHDGADDHGHSGSQHGGSEFVSLDELVQTLGSR